MIRTDKPVRPEILRSFKPFNQLGFDELSDLTEDVCFETAADGEVLFHSGLSDPWLIYLVSGAVRLERQGGGSEEVAGGKDVPKIPLDHDKPRASTAVAQGGLIFFRIPESRVIELLGRDWNRPEQEQQAPVDPETRFMTEIQEAFNNQQLKVPSLPDVALKVRDAVNAPGTDVDTLTRLIQIDPPLAARLIQVANSPLHRAPTKITSLRMAISRLGLGVTRDLVMSCSLQQLFDSEAPVLTQKLKDVWRHSTFVGAIAAVLTRVTPKLDPDRAMLAGLVHNIGVLPIIAHIEAYPDLFASSQQLDPIINRHNAKIGSAVLRQWGFDNELVKLPRECRDWSRDEAGDASYADLVSLAILYSYIDTPKAADHPQIDQIPAYNKLPLGRLGPRMTIKVLEEAKGEIAEIQRLLQG